MSQEWPATGSGELNEAVHAWDILKEVAIIFINSTIQPPEITQTGETDSWRAQTKTCVHQDPGENSSDPKRD